METKRVYSVATPAHLKAFGGNPDYKANQAKAKSKQGYPVSTTQCCVLCGKKARGDLSAMLSNMGLYITKEEYNNSDDLGYYPVGSDCAKKLKAADIPVYKTPFYKGQG
jgi:hypothetical protein